MAWTECCYRGGRVTQLATSNGSYRFSVTRRSRYSDLAYISTISGKHDSIDIQDMQGLLTSNRFTLGICHLTHLTWRTCFIVFFLTDRKPPASIATVTGGGKHLL